MKLTHKGKEIATFVFIERPAALLEGPEETAVVTHQENKVTVIKRPTLLVAAKYSICGQCRGEIWQAYEQPDWASNVCDHCFPTIQPDKIVLQPMPQRRYVPRYLPDGTVDTHLSDGSYLSGYSPCQPGRCNALTGAIAVLVGSEVDRS